MGVKIQLKKGADKPQFHQHTNQQLITSSESYN